MSPLDSVFIRCDPCCVVVLFIYAAGLVCVPPCVAMDVGKAVFTDATQTLLLIQSVKVAPVLKGLHLTE